MSLPLLIGLSGKKRRGKDTLGDCLVKNFGFTRFAFADSLKQAALDINPLVQNSLTGEVAELQNVYNQYGSFEGIKDSPWNPSVRIFLQQFGSVMSIRDNNIWARPVVREALEHVRSTGNGAVITDCRFPWEVEMIQAIGVGAMVRVYRSDLPDANDRDEHISETLLDDICPDQFFDTTPLDVTFTDRVGLLLENLAIQKMSAGSKVDIGQSCDQH
jgi:hypothetical protein